MTRAPGRPRPRAALPWQAIFSSSMIVLILALAMMIWDVRVPA